MSAADGLVRGLGVGLFVVSSACDPKPVEPASLPPLGPTNAASSPPSRVPVPPPSVTAAPLPRPAPMASAAELVEAFETALNAGDLGAAERQSEAACWQKDCQSLAEQATQKFKVRRSGSPQVRGLHAAVWLDVLCDGTRLCDRVLLLMAKGCGDVGAWRVAQVTERKQAEASWLESALADCPKF